MRVISFVSARPILWGGLTIAVVAAACWAWSGSDKASPRPTDAGQATRSDAEPAVDAGQDATKSEADAGISVPLTTRVGAAGAILVMSQVAMALFKEDQQIIQSPVFPECTIQIGSGDRAFSFAGTMTLGGDAVGQHGGIAAPFRITPTGPDFSYFGAADTGAFFERASGQKVQVDLAGTPHVPLLAPTTLRSPMFADVVRVTSPALPDGGDSLAIKSSEPFELKWNVPSGTLGEEKLVVTFFSLQSDAAIGELRCGFPIGAGHATVPVELLKGLRRALGPATGGIVPGFIHIRTGGFEISSQERAVYTIEVTHQTDVSFAEGADTPINFE